jgi:hypothetical protein
MPASHARNYLYQLTGMGWCYGEGEQATYQYRWHKCGPSSHRLTIEDLHSYDKPAMAVTGVHGNMPECQRNPIAPQDSGRCEPFTPRSSRIGAMLPHDWKEQRCFLGFAA